MGNYWMMHCPGCGEVTQIYAEAIFEDFLRRRVRVECIKGHSWITTEAACVDAPLWREQTLARGGGC
jgi:hypothetical protein